MTRLAAALLGIQTWGLLIGAVGLGCSISLANIGWISAAVALLARLLLRQTRWTPLPMLWPVVGVVVTSLLSGLLGAQPGESLREIFQEDDVLLLIVLVVGQTVAEHPAMTPRLLGWFLGGSLFCVGFGYLQQGLQMEGQWYGNQIVGVPQWLAGMPRHWLEYLTLSDWRVKGTRSMPSTFAEGLAFAMAVAAALAATDAGRRRRLIGITVALAGGVLLSLTRGAWLGAAAGLGVILLLGSRKPLRLAAALAAGLLVCLLWAPGTKWGQRVHTILDPRAWRAEASLRWRLEMWRTGLEIGRDFPLFGIGVGNVSLLYPAYRRPLEGHRVWGDLHSDWLNRWVERGFTGVAAWVWFIVAHLRAAWPSGGWVRLLAAGLWAASLGMGLTETTLGDAEIFMDLAFLVGLTQGIRRAAPGVSEA